MIVVVGGSGFVGTRFCRRLQAAGQDFVIVDKNPSAAFPDRVRIADVRDPEQLRQAIPQAEVLVNLAAEHRDDVRPRSLYDEVNVGGARNLVAVAAERGIRRIVFTSSVAVYGFAPPDTGEDGRIAPFNDYGRTKYEAEGVFEAWRDEAPEQRSLVIVRPTVIFGEQNRGNVYNLLSQIARGRFLMIGDGRNVKSMAYVENVAAFLQHTLTLPDGRHLYNYIDKPDLDMNTLVSTVRRRLGAGDGVGLRLPLFMGLAAGHALDLVAAVTRRNFVVSAIRVRKFTATTQFASAAASSGFVAPVGLAEALERTVHHEFIADHGDQVLFYSE
ncbi:NAD-dependent epimerase/dehydratase family protein [Arenimonas composti]|uniref:NAD-dependent epimerase/dehydratase domain-containing protein n=1 Tax=Arenimonas composti TR7-09 = DSM 18010 TaxID=1121013 RepID=A0A091BBK5_9GAMM|nr:NAD-dependent epimerase/dehydratase family protein [Arenimonas composti]KFN48882.1 hypothetical protein P873_13090 [Arenimonas composti TR7-09 = DSM 18010]